MNIYRSSGQYIGFINQDYFFLWDGKYIGWMDNQNYVWDKEGNFKGQLTERGGFHYITRNTYQVPPIAKTPRPAPAPPIPPTPSNPAPALSLPIGVEDSF